MLSHFVSCYALLSSQAAAAQQLWHSSPKNILSSSGGIRRNSPDLGKGHQTDKVSRIHRPGPADGRNRPRGSIPVQWFGCTSRPPSQSAQEVHDGNYISDHLGSSFLMIHGSALLLSTPATQPEGLATHLHLMIQVSQDFGGRPCLVYNHNYREWAAAKSIRVWGRPYMPVPPCPRQEMLWFQSASNGTMGTASARSVHTSISA